MSSLKQKIREYVGYVQCPKCNEIIINSALAKSNHLLCSHNNIPYAMWEKVLWKGIVRLDDVFELLDEATKQVLLFQKEAFKEFTKNPNAHDRYYAGKIDAYTEVLAVLEGAEQK